MNQTSETEPRRGVRVLPMLAALVALSLVQILPVPGLSAPAFAEESEQGGAPGEQIPGIPQGGSGGGSESESEASGSDRGAEEPGDPPASAEPEQPGVPGLPEQQPEAPAESAPRAFSSGGYSFENAQIARKARSYALGSWQGQCKIFAGNVVGAVLAANGITVRIGGYGTPGGAYYGSYERAGGRLIPMNDAKPGDLIQTIRADQKNSDYPSEYGLHTAIVVERTATQGSYLVRDSNWSGAETVGEHVWNLNSWKASRGVEAYVWRFGNADLLELAAAPALKISGTAKPGSTLQAAAGEWKPAPVSLSYQWLRDGTPIGGATQPAYTVTAADLGRQLTASVTGSKAGYIPASTTATPVTVPSALAGSKVDRLSGDDRYATAVSVSRAAFTDPSKVSTVIIANGLDFADALSAAPLAAKLNAPLLLTAPDALPDSTVDEILRLKPSTILVAGGTGVVSERVEARLKNAGKVVRLQGENRYATSLAIARYGWKQNSSSAAFVVTGTDFADALSIGAAAGKLKAPVLLVPGQSASLSDDVGAFIATTGATKIFIAGGTGAVSPQIESALKQRGAVTRYAGADRYATSALIAQAHHTKKGSVYLALGDDFPDALAGAVVSGRAGAPLLLSRQGCIPAQIVPAITTIAPARTVLLGGSGALTDAVAQGKGCF